MPGSCVQDRFKVQPPADIRTQLEVNLFGRIAVTQAFLPLIRRGGGRLVNVGSIGGRLVLPLHGAYSASKFAFEAVTDAFRLELRQWGIPVSLVDPGGGTRRPSSPRPSPRSMTWRRTSTHRGISLYETPRSLRCVHWSRRPHVTRRPRIRTRAVSEALTAKPPEGRAASREGREGSCGHGEDAPGSAEGPRRGTWRTYPPGMSSPGRCQHNVCGRG